MRLWCLCAALLVLRGSPAWAAARGEEDPNVPALGAWHAALAQRADRTNRTDEVAALVERARAEIAVGAYERAAALLAAASAAEGRADPTVLRLRGMAEHAQGRYLTAGLLFAAAAERALGRTAGVLDARAGDAFEAASLHGRARVHYRRAARRLPEARGWLAAREARLLADTAAVARLLLRAGPAEQALAADAWADALARVGDTARAVTFRVRAGRPAAAAVMALRAGDRTLGRRLFYLALREDDTRDLVAALEAALTASPPRNADELIAVVGALRRVGRLPEAARLLRAAVLANRDAWLLVAAAEAQADAGDRAAALATLELALGQTGRAAGDAAYARARLLLRVRGERAAIPALLAFTRRFADHPAVPAALFLVADAREQAGNRRAADSLYELIGSRWPHHAVASQAFLRLAANAERASRFGRARELYAAVRDGRGPDAAAARFMLGRVAQKAGDSTEAAAEWAVLAGADSLGYYALLARGALGLPPPAIDQPTWPAAGTLLARVLPQLALLDAMEFSPEATALVEWSGSALGRDGEQLLVLGRWLLGAGQAEPAVNLGWRASQVVGLNDARVLHLVFPWPLRDLVVAEAKKFGLDPYLLAGLIRQESLFRPGVTSRAGAQGLMQLMPGTAATIARQLGVEWHDGLLGVPDANLHMGAAHLASLIRRFRGDEILALAAYNAGGRPVERWRQRWSPAADWVQFVERIPYAETRGYVRTVVRNRTLYRALYPPSESR
jgi:soluble lytic murein transglycosylase